MASAINYNTVWTSIFEPLPTFAFLRRYAKTSEFAAKHDQPFHVVGSDLAGVVLRVGPGVTRWQTGDEVVAHCLSVELEDPQGHDDTMMDPQQRIWGFETNFGGLAELALVKSNQLMPKAAHLSWEEAACPGLVNSTAYRQLVSRHGADMKQGDVVLIWGASGGLGSYATQYAVHGGAIPVCVVSSPGKAELCRRMGAELVIDRTAEGFEFWRDGVQQPRRMAAARRADPRADRRRGPRHRLRAPGPGDVRGECLRGPTRRHGCDVCLDLWLLARVRQPLPVDEFEKNHRFTFRQLSRVLGGQSADYPRPGPPHAVPRIRAPRNRAGRVRRTSQSAPGQGWRAVLGARGRAGRARR